MLCLASCRLLVLDDSRVHWRKTGSHAVITLSLHHADSTTNCLQFVLLSIQSSIVHNAGYDVVSSRAAHHSGPHNCSRTIFSWTGRSSGTSSL